MAEIDNSFLGRAHRGEAFSTPKNFHSFEFGLPGGHTYRFDYRKSDETIRVGRFTPSTRTRLRSPYEIESHDAPYILTTDVLLQERVNVWQVRSFSYTEDAPVLGLIVHDEVGSSLLIIQDETRGFINGTGILNRANIGTVDLSKHPQIPLEHDFRQQLWNVLPPRQQGMVYRALILSSLAADISQQVSA